MNYTSLRPTVPAAAYPVTVAEVKAHLHQDIALDDALLQGYIAAATDWAENETGRALIFQTWAMKMPAFPSGDYRAIYLPKPPLSSVTSITYVDDAGVVQTLAGANYVAVADPWEPLIYAAVGTTWPGARTQPDAVTVTYVAGYSADATSVPEAIKLAIKMMVQGYYDNLKGEDRDALERAARGIVSPYRLIRI